jgi:hypothetical protein
LAWLAARPPDDASDFRSRLRAGPRFCASRPFIRFRLTFGLVAPNM